MTKSRWLRIQSVNRVFALTLTPLTDEDRSQIEERIEQLVHNNPTLSPTNARAKDSETEPPSVSLEVLDEYYLPERHPRLMHSLSHASVPRFVSNTESNEQCGRSILVVITSDDDAFENLPEITIKHFCLLLLLVGIAPAQHCRKIDIDKSSGFCTVPDHSLTPGKMQTSLAVRLEQ